MLRAYIEFVHPYMPLLDLHDFLAVIDRPDGSLGRVSLILFQAVMFAGSAFVDMDHLRFAGYATRKEARKDFFQKTRVSNTTRIIFVACRWPYVISHARRFAASSARKRHVKIGESSILSQAGSEEQRLTAVLDLVRLRLRV